MRIDIELAHIKRIAEHVSVQFPDDPDLLADVLEGETDLHELCARLISKIEDEDGQIAALKSQVEARNIRKKRAESRKKGLRDAILQLLDAADQKKLTLPEATLSRTTRKPKPVVTDADALPPEFTKVVTSIKPDMDKIKAAETMPPGVTMDNGGESLTVRMK